MVRGEIYGALLKRLNRGVIYINCDRVAEEIEDDDDDVETVMDELRQASLSRRINQNEYELVCTVDQLKSYILSREDLSGGAATKGEFDEKGDKPITLNVLEDSLWRVVKDEPKREEARESLFARHRDRMRRHLEESNHRLSSMFDNLNDDDDDDDEKDEENRRALILSLLSKCPNVDMEKKTFDLYMPIKFPNSEIQLSMGWGIDDEGDYYLTDTESFYRYLLEQIRIEDFPQRELLISAIINRITKRASLASRDNLIINYLTDVDDEDDFFKDINEIVLGFTRSVKIIADMLEPVIVSSENSEEYIEGCIAEFLDSYDISNDMRPAISRRGVERFTTAIIKKIVTIDPRITRSGAIDIANRIKEKIMADVDKMEQYRAINEVITELNCMTDRLFWAIKTDGYFE